MHKTRDNILMGFLFIAMVVAALHDANGPSLLDYVVLLASIPAALLVGQPFFRPLVVAAIALPAFISPLFSAHPYLQFGLLYLPIIIFTSSSCSAFFKSPEPREP